MGAPLSEPLRPGTEMVPRPEILVVDDDPSLRQMLGALLSQQGFQVHLASSGKSAIAVYRRHQDTVRGVLLDIHMPDMDGPATLAALQAINPALTCCFMTGHAGTHGHQGLLDLGAVDVLYKPFVRPLEMGDELRRVFGIEE